MRKWHIPRGQGTTRSRNQARRNGRGQPAWLCAGLAIALLLAGWLVAAQERRHDTSLAQAHGHITALFLRCGFYSVRRRTTGCQWFPVVRFATTEGQAITLVSNVGAREPAFDQGQGVQVRYDPHAQSVQDSAFIVGYGLRYSSFLYRLALAAASLACLLALMQRREQQK